MADTKISALTGAATPLAGTEVVPLVQSGATKNVSVANLTAGRAVSMGSGAVTGNLTVDTNVLYVDATNNRVGVNCTPIAGFHVGNPSDANQGLRILFTDATTAALNSSRLSTGSNQKLALYGQDAVEFFTNGNKRWYVNTTGNLVANSSGLGIDFSADSHAAGMTSELLDDYEEGTWTPVYATTGTQYTSVTYGIQTGVYTKVGNMVSIKLRIRTSAVTIGSASGALIITGLPFTSAGFASPVTIGYAADFSTNAPINAEVNGSATTIALYYRATVGGSVASMQYNYLNTAATTNDLTIAGFYYV